MSFLIIFCLVVALVWQGRRLWLMRRNIHDLGRAVQQRTPFLHEDTNLIKESGGWAVLVREINSLVVEVRQANEDRRDQLSQLETTLGNLQEAVLILDENNYILLVNNALLKIFSRATRTVGQRVETVLQSGEFFDHLVRVRAGSAASRREIEFSSVATGSIWVEVTGAVIRNAGTSKEGWVLFVLHDITRQKRLEEVRKVFVANVSHELKTPLSVIKGYAETLADDHMAMPPETRASFLRTILHHTERLSAIVEDLLALSRLEAPGAALQASSEDLVALIRSVARDFAERYQAAAHVLSLAVETDAIHLDCDPLKLGQVFTNLLDNALRHTPPGSRVELGARIVPGCDQVEVWAADDGPGIPAADLPRIFERFYRVEKGRSREKGGTGLGLSIVKHIVQLHGGTVRAESQVGQGTRIVIRLPLTRQKPVADPVVS